MKKIIISLFISLLCTAAYSQTTTTVTADFSTWVEYPLVKKIGTYQTPLVTRDWLQRDLSKMAELESRSFRYELAWGKDLYTSLNITGSATDVKYNWSTANFLFNKAAQHSQAIIFCHGYMPPPIQSASGNLAWQSPPNNYSLWQEVNRTAAENWRDHDYSNRYIEVWNEPDLPGGFFSGTVDDYVKIYQYAALGSKAGDPDAKVGGPGGALQWWHDPLVNHCLANNLPLDFLSGHAYGVDFTWQLNAMRNAINRLGNRNAEMLMTEYSPYPAAEYAANGPVERAEAAMTFFQAVPTILEYTDLTYLTWAQYIDPEAGTSGKAYSDWDKLGLIDGNYGFRKALFNAFKLYGMMPVDRVSTTLPASSPLGSLASTSDDCSTLVLWNPTTKNYSVNATLKNLPVKEGHLQVYNIDESINSWYETGDDNLVPSLDCDTTASSFGNLILRQLKLKSKGVLFIRFQANDAKELFPNNPFAKIIRTDQWYEATRDNANPYAYFDSKTWTAFLSTCARANGTAIVGVTAEDLPENIRVTSKSNTLTDRNNNSEQAIRIDFQNTSGNYVSSVLFHGGIYHEASPLILPWGSKAAPRKVVKVNDMKDFSFKLSDYAPANFSGRAVITFILAQTGANTRCNFQLHKADDFLVGNVRADEVAPTYLDLHVNTIGSYDNVVKTGFVSSVNNDPRSITKVVEAETSEQGNAFSAKLTALQSNKAYHIRGLAILNSGDTIFTPEAIIHTPAKPSNVVISKVDCDTVALTAKLTGNVRSSSSPVYKKGFVWAREKDNPMPDFSNNVVFYSAEGTGSYICNISNLKSETIYAVRAFTFSRAGVTFSEPQSFSTNPFTTDIQTPSSSEPVPVDIYDITGRRVDSITSGIFIIRYSDGSIRKIYK